MTKRLTSIQRRYFRPPHLSSAGESRRSRHSPSPGSSASWTRLYPVLKATTCVTKHWPRTPVRFSSPTTTAMKICPHTGIRVHRCRNPAGLTFVCATWPNFIWVRKLAQLYLLKTSFAAPFNQKSFKISWKGQPSRAKTLQSFDSTLKRKNNHCVII